MFALLFYSIWRCVAVRGQTYTTKSRPYISNDRPLHSNDSEDIELAADIYPSYNSMSMSMNHYSSRPSPSHSRGGQKSIRPSKTPTNAPSKVSCGGSKPSGSASAKPSNMPTSGPSVNPSNIPTPTPSVMVSNEPTSTPTITEHSNLPSNHHHHPSQAPSTPEPTGVPSDLPSLAPSVNLKNVSSLRPSFVPTMVSAKPSMSTMPTFKCGEPGTRRAQIFEILASITPQVELDDVTTPAGKALTWLLEDDALQLCAKDNDEHLIQRYVIVKLYFQTNGDGWLECSRPLTSGVASSCNPPSSLLDGTAWLDVTAHECDWAFLTCSNNQEITRIEIDDNFVTGMLINEVDQLVELRVFSMEGAPNAIEGTIPTQFGNLSSIRVIDLDENRLTGSIPEEIYGAITLEKLDLDTNLLTGTISTKVGELVNLVLLQLFDNYIAGTIPSELGNLEQLGTSKNS